MKKTILITGSSGSIGSEALKHIADTEKYNIRIILREKKANLRLAESLQKKYRENLKVIFGDLSIFADCERAVESVDYIIHCAAMIPPVIDHNPDEGYKSNFLGTLNLINAVKKQPQNGRVKFIHIGTVAQYGNRTFKHPWIRTGDPLLVVPFDFYGATKIMAEREVIESGLKHWVSLRQSAVLYDDIMLKNMDDGLMFHTGWNTPIEWVTARTSGLMLKNLIEKDADGTLTQDFWRRVYNVGNGKEARVTGYETLGRGFKLMGCSVKEIFKPHWNAARNCHCGWFYDSGILNDYLDFQHEGFEDFFKKLDKKFWYFKLGKPFPHLIGKIAVEPLLKTKNAPLYWIKHNFEGRIRAFFGSKDDFEKIPQKWEDYKLLCENKNPETGEKLNYDELKDESRASSFLLNHGYDESKKESGLCISDFSEAARFRGGECLSTEMKEGDLYTPLEWACAYGHKFKASPFLVLKAGHWCPECTCPPWNFDEQAKKVPFYAQIWYDDHGPDENNFYDKDCFRDILDNYVQDLNT